MNPRFALIRTRLEETWVCKSTAVLCATAELAELASEVLLYQSKRLLRFSRTRFLAYVDRVETAREPLDPPG